MIPSSARSTWRLLSANCSACPLHPQFQGRPLQPLLQDAGAAWDEAVFLEYGRFGISHDNHWGFVPSRTIRTRQHKLVLNLCDKDELYDLAADPGEMHNRIDDLSLVEIRTQLHDRLLDWMIERMDPLRGQPWYGRPWRSDLRLDPNQDGRVSRVETTTRTAMIWMNNRIKGRTNMPVLNEILNRYSCRSYQDRPIEQEKLDRIVEAARLAPSASNLQEWRFVFVRDAELRQQMQVAANNQPFVSQAAVVIAACAENDYVMRCGQRVRPDRRGDRPGAYRSAGGGRGAGHLLDRLVLPGAGAAGLRASRRTWRSSN